MEADDVHSVAGAYEFSQAKLLIGSFDTFPKAEYAARTSDLAVSTIALN